MYEEIAGGYKGIAVLLRGAHMGFAKGPAVAERMRDSTMRTSMLAREELRIVVPGEQVGKSACDASAP
jgi:hypothetical protein